MSAKSKYFQKEMSKNIMKFQLSSLNMIYTFILTTVIIQPVAILPAVPDYLGKPLATLMQHSASLFQGTVFSWIIRHSGEDGHPKRVAIVL